MPYEIRHTGDKYCVHKVGDDKSMGCHDSEDDAKEQMAAIHANERKSIQKPTQAEAGYIAVSTKEGKACESCRWFDSEVSMCHTIENYPEDISEKGYCERHEVSPLADTEKRELIVVQPYNLSEGVVHTYGTIWETDKHEAPEVVYIAPDSNAIESAIVSAFRSFVHGFTGEGLKPGQTVIKGADGARYMLIVTSNSYQDRDAETMTTDALKADVNRHWTGDDTAFMSDNPLLFWHDDRARIGDVVYGDVKGAFYVELAKEAANPLAKAIFDYREAHPDEKWGASHRFEYYRAHRANDGTFAAIRKRETSILPREAAANALTFSGVIPMPTKRDDYLNKMLGLENAAELLDKGIDALMAELDKKGIEHKSADEDPAAEVEAAGDKYGNLLVSLIEAQAELDERLTAKETELATATKAFDDARAADAETIEKLTGEVADLKAQLDARPRSASRAVETEIEQADIPASVKDALKKRDKFWNTEVEGL